MKISELMDGIRKRDLVLPEFQREYVWTKEQVKQLVVSLFKSYPVGSLLFWKTDDPPELKNLPEPPDKVGMTDVILDGQQRLTTLYMLTDGTIPPYYTDRDIERDPRDLYFNLDTGDFQYYQLSKMRGNPLWRSVQECFADAINVFAIAKQQATRDDEAFPLAQRYNENLNQLRNIREMDMPVLNVPPDATIGDAIDIFDRVNSLGTKLTEADLALTHVTGTWPHARRKMKDKIEELSESHFYFDLTFTTRALTAVVTKRALFPSIHDRPREELERGWGHLETILDYLVTVLPQRMFIHSTEDLNTTNVLVPYVAYLALNEGKFPSDGALKRASHWLYAAHTWSRYTAQTDQRLEHDLSVVVREPTPWSQLCDQIIDQRGRIEVKASDLDGRWIQHPLCRMTHMLAKAHGAVDWFNGAPLGSTHGKTYKIHYHHIFPQSRLYEGHYDADNSLHRTIVNQIANRAFLTATSNVALSNAPPEEYMPEVEQRYPGALAKQFIPMDASLWKVERYPDFLEARRELISMKLNEYMNALISEPEILHERKVEDLIELGESATLEFKATLRWDLIQNKTNRQLLFSVVKTVVAFLNTDGGTLIIGVEDDGTVHGLDNDLKTFSDRSLDSFGQTLANVVNDYIGAQFSPFIKPRFEMVDGTALCVVDIAKAPEPAFMDGPRGIEFFVRVGNTSRSLDPEATVRFIEMNWD